MSANSTWLVTAVTVMYALMCGVGLLFYVSFLIAVLKTKSLRGNSFYRLSVALGVADCWFLLVNLCYCTPAIYLQRTWGPFDQKLLGFALEISWFPALFLVGILAVDRYVQICGSVKLQKQLFSTKGTWLLIAGSWTAGLLVSMHAIHDDYLILFHADDFSWAYDTTTGAKSMCLVALAPFLAPWIFSTLEVVIVTLITALAFCCNTAVFRKIYQQHRSVADSLTKTKQQQDRNRRELRMFAQFFIVSLVLLVYDLSFNVLPRLFEFTPAMGIWISFIYLLNGSCNGYVYFAVNSQVRKVIVDMWMCRKQNMQARITLVKSQIMNK